MPGYIARETRLTARERTDGLECHPTGPTEARVGVALLGVAMRTMLVP